MSINIDNLSADEIGDIESSHHRTAEDAGVVGVSQVDDAVPSGRTGGCPSGEKVSPSGVQLRELREGVALTSLYNI